MTATVAAAESDLFDDGTPSAPPSDDREYVLDYDAGNATTETPDPTVGDAGQADADCPRVSKPPTMALHDVALAERFLAEHGTAVRYCEVLKQWYVWTETRWTPDKTRKVVELAKGTGVRVYVELTDPDALRKLKTSGEVASQRKFATRSAGTSGISAMTALASADPRIAVHPNQLDSDPWLLTCANGVVDLRTAELRPADPADLSTKLAPVAFDPDAACPEWEAFLGTIFAGDRELAGFVQRAVGYSLTGVTREQVMFLPHGHGRNGKSTFLETLSQMLGDYAQHAPSDSLLTRKESGIPNDLARMQGARFVTAVETGDGRSLDEAPTSASGGGCCSCRSWSPSPRSRSTRTCRPG